MWNISMHASRTLLRISALAICVLPMHGQTADTGAIAGTVSDPSGALVSRAAVVINSQGTGEKRDLATDDEGNLLVQFLTPGSYDLTVRAAGFEPFILKGVQVQITEVSRVKMQLALSSKEDQIAVSAAPSLLQTENATFGRVIGRNTIEELPLVNRNFTEILGLTAGTNTDIVDATQLGAGSQEIRANGARSGDNNFMLNGVDANSYSSNMTEVTPFGGAGIAIPAPDTIQEFKVQTSLYDAQYGRGAGANVTVETRSGTAEVHGNAYYFGRNEALDANNFFANATGVPRGEFRRSQPGGTLGGPTPWSKKRAFFFVSYQATRDVNAASLSSSVSSLSLPPIPQVRTPASLGAVFGGQTGALGGVAVAPDGSNISPVALNLLNAKNPDGTYVIPSPQTSRAGVNYTAVVPGHYNEDQFNTNFDFNLRTADRLSAKFFFSDSNQDVPFFGAIVPGFPALRSFENRNLAIAETHIFSPRAINQFRFGFSRNAGQGDAGGTLTDQDVGINSPNGAQRGIVSVPIRDPDPGVCLDWVCVWGLLASQLVRTFGWPAIFVVGGVLPIAVAPLLALLPNSGAERSQESRQNPVAALFRDGLAPITLLLWSMSLLNVLVIHFIKLWMPTILHSTGESPTRSILAASMYSLGALAGLFITAPFVDKVGIERVLTCALAVGAFCVLAIGAFHLPLWLLFAVLFGAGIGGSCDGGITTLSRLAYRAGIRSTGASWAMGAGRIGSIAGPLLGGMLLAFNLQPRSIFVAAFIPALCVALLMVVLGRLRHRQGRTV